MGRGTEEGGVGFTYRRSEGKKVWYGNAAKVILKVVSKESRIWA